MKCGLVNDVDRLFADQIHAWPLLARGIEGLRNSQTRTEVVAGHDMLVRHIPHRIGSTTAAVDAVSVAKRPCFLCAANLPPGEKGIPFDSEFTIYCNPFPILDRHLTIVHTQHRPQRIAGSTGAMLRLAQALPDSFVIYNGPHCGASAPDHLHFQACSRDTFPIERDVQEFDGPSMPKYGRRVLIFRDNDIQRLIARLDATIRLLADVTRSSDEPMLNIAAFFDGARWVCLLFPRRKHRPRVYDTGELTVSPATIDLCGIFVVPVPHDFQKIRGTDIERVFEEVTLGADAFELVLSGLGNVS
jgi:hypothetical protein